MSIYYCDNCKVYFDDSDMVEMKPDGGFYHWECKKDELQELTHEEIIEVLNDNKKLLSDISILSRTFAGEYGKMISDIIEGKTN